MCGGTSIEGHAFIGLAGLSPRVRGNQRQRPHPRRHRGSIPACAGEPGIRPGSGCGPWVYPRVCGGTAWRIVRRPAVPGLSPRVRGNRGSAPRERAARGSIPACAGEPARRPAAAWTPRVYPRVCGGTTPTASRYVRPAGLSPRVRGNPDLAAATYTQYGSIPACAGEPKLENAMPGLSWVYPRVCGGTDRVSGSVTTLQGLSPRVRGNRDGGGLGGGFL